MKLSFIVIDSRSDKHPDWVRECIESIKSMDEDNAELIVVNNIGRKLTIGEAFNYGVRQSKGDWCVFVGDDDSVEADYAQTIRRYASGLGSNYVCIATNMTAFNDETGDNYPMRRQSTGAWRRVYLLNHPFNEKLDKGIDREHIEEAVKNGYFIFVINYYYGYYYRRHNDYHCAGDVVFHKEPSDYYFVTTNRAFLSPIENEFKKYGSVFIDTTYDYELAKKAKIVWVEWANKKAIDISNDKLDAKKILRVHAFEVFSEYAPQINWNGFDVVIFIDEYIKRYAEEKFGKISGAIVIPNGIDLDRFKFSDKPKNNKIAFAGYLTRKKGIGELMLIAKSLPEYRFYLAGKYQENDIADWMKTKKPDNVFVEEWKYDDAMNDFYQDKSFVINTSMRESQAVTIMEAMACGLKPLVADWIGAKEIYGDYVYRNIDELKALLKGSYQPEIYRNFIETHYDMKNILPKILEAAGVNILIES